MNGVRGLANWRWIFILEGILTVLIGFVSFFLLTDFPREAKWLTSQEKKFVLAKTKTNEAHTAPMTLRDVAIFFKSIRNILGGIMYFSMYYSRDISYCSLTIALAAVVPIYCKISLIFRNTG